MAAGRWTSIGNLAEIPLEGARVVVSPGCRIAVFRTADNRVFALEDRCPHRQGPLSQGIVHGTQITCPLHNLVIDLENGQAQEAGATPVRTVPVRMEEDGAILLDADAISAMQEA